jgi:hypothetical protein
MPSCGRRLLVLAPVLSPFAQRAAAQSTSCPDLGRPRTYRNARFRFQLDYPERLALDPESVPEANDSARFWTPDRRVTAVVNGSGNLTGLSLEQMMREAEGDILQNGRGDITYRRRRDNWFVLSGHMAGRIYYRRTMLLRSGAAATLWMEFPPELRPCLDGAVTLMSLSFREL